MITLTAPSLPQAEVAPTPSARDRRPVLLAWAALMLVLAVGLPLFLCMPLTYDTVQYDLCARTLLRGGVLYRDSFDNNLPGVIWMQAAIRAIVGWRSEALRLADFGVMGLVVLLLLRWLPAGGAARVGTATVLAVFYLFSAEHIHCQRDCWMLLPAVAALSLRRRQLLPAGGPASGAPFVWGLLEGLLWGAAVWIKPFVLIPAAAGWLVGNRVARREPRAVWLDAGGMLAGGLAVGGAGVAWLATSGAWNSFWEFTVVWNREYAGYVQRESRTMGLYAMTVYYLPWSLVHLAAVPVALTALARALGSRAAADRATASRALLSAFYLAWLAQAAGLQRITDYGMASSAFPAIVLAADAVRSGFTPFLRRTTLVAVALAALLLAPGLRPARLALWARCCREGSTPELRDRLTVPTWRNPPDWQDLARVEEYLRAQGAADGEVTCLSGFTYPLYLDINLESPTRFHGVEPCYRYFPSHVGQVRAEVEATPTRFVVSDLAYTADLTEEEARETDPNDPLALPPMFLEKFEGAYPWDGWIVFRSGKYVVHRVNSFAGFFWLDEAKAAGNANGSDRYAKFFAGRLSLADEKAARRGVAAIDELYRRSEAEHDIGARHQALVKALTMFDQANLSGKRREAEIFRRWIAERMAENTEP